MILNKLASLSWPRLLHVALSLLCVLALVLGLASEAFAVYGDTDGNMVDFTIFYPSTSGVGLWNAQDPGIDLSDPNIINPYKPNSFRYTSSNSTYYITYILISLPKPLVSGILYFRGSEFIVSPSVTFRNHRVRLYDENGVTLGGSSLSSSTPLQVDIEYGTKYIGYAVQFTLSSSSPATMLTVDPRKLEYYDFLFQAGGSEYDPAIDQNILDGVIALASSFNDLETGPYYGVSGVTVDQNGDLQHTLTHTASLEDLLNALGIAGTDTNHVIRGIYNNFGSYFTLYSIDDSTSSTTQVYRGLPQYVNALGQSVTDGINRLQRDHDLLYQQTSSLASDLDDALYADTDSSPSQSWSVAEWLKGIYNSITSFISSFWSPAETDLKEAAEDGMQEAADRGIAGSADQVGDMDDLGSGFSSFGDTGNVGAGDILNSLTSGDYSFFSETTQDNLSFHPPVSENRGLRSAPSDPVEYVDELSRNRDYLREVLGLP